MTRGPLRAGLLPCVLWFCCCVAALDGQVDDGKNSTRGVDEFLMSLTQMIGTALNSDARYSQLLLGDDDGIQQSGISGRPNRPSDYFDIGRPPFAQDNGRPPFPQNDGRPYPSPPYFENGRPQSPPGYPPQDGRPGFLGVRPPYPYGPYPGPSRYPQQNSVLQALSSISQYDDLRCVPRLLCEVSSGTRPSSGYYQPGYYQQQQQQSSIPFLTKDALTTLLTVLNFVDDSPLLMFGRAALLGYNARGDPRSCTTAYPTCPRDPDQLINYLNNHNGGFFRFFNQQLPQYAPQYAPFQRPGNQQPLYQQPPYQQPPYQRPPYQPPHYEQPFYQQQQQQYAPQYVQPQQHFGGGGYKARADSGGPDVQQRPRILSGSASQYYDVPSVHDLPLDVTGSPTMTFPSDSGPGAGSAALPFTFPSSDRGGKNRQAKRVKMIFPDRTGTGGLRADVDKYGNYKGVYYADGAIKFVDDDGGPRGDDKRPPPSRIRLPGRPADDFEVLGNRLPYEKRRKLQFPTNLTA